MSNPQAIHVKARAVLRQLGHVENEPQREYTDWHICIRGGVAFVSVWSSGQMVFLSLNSVPVFHRSGPWEEYLERLFQKTSR